MRPATSTRRRLHLQVIKAAAASVVVEDRNYYLQDTIACLDWKRSAFALLGQVTVWRLEHGRPMDEPRPGDRIGCLLADLAS